MTDKPKIRLLDIHRPDLKATLDAGFKENGDLELKGNAEGKLSAQLFGDSDYEYWITLPVASLSAFAREASKELGFSPLSGEPDQAGVMDLIRQLFLAEGESKPTFSAESEFMKWLDQKDIPYKFMSF